nr:hypothetical protein [Prevotella sp.]
MHIFTNAHTQPNPEAVISITSAAVMSLSCISSTFCSDGLVTFFASHSLQYRHFVAVTLISSPQYGQRFVPVVTILVPLPYPISRHI